MGQLVELVQVLIDQDRLRAVDPYVFTVGADDDDRTEIYKKFGLEKQSTHLKEQKVCQFSASFLKRKG